MPCLTGNEGQGGHNWKPEYDQQKRRADKAQHEADTCKKCAQGWESKFNQLNGTHNTLVKVNMHREAVICALVSEMRSELGQGRFEDLIEGAEERGQIAITPFLKEHLQEDKDRLKEMLKTDLSQHEIDLLKEMVKNGEM